MNIDDLGKLLSVNAQTAISIYAPTNKTFPENQNDRIVVKNKVLTALNEIHQSGPKRDFEKIVANLNSAFDSVDWNNSTEGIALFVSEEGFWKYDLNHSPYEQIIISDKFMIAEIVKSLNMLWEFYLLVLSESPTKLFKGNRQGLTEIKGEFPLFHTGRGGAAASPTEFGKQTAVILDEEHRKFFRKVSEEFLKVKSGDSLPLIVTGVDRFLSFWREVSPDFSLVPQIHGSYDFMSNSELMNLIWPEAQKLFDTKNSGVIERLEIALGNKTYAGGFEEVIEMAQIGRVSMLVVADEEITNPLTEVAIRFTLEGGGGITFIPAAELTKFAKISADLRY
jgi:hypothetical protein